MESKDRTERDEFRNKLKEEWRLVWRERYDDRIKAEGIVIRDYPLVFMDRGFVLFASRESKTPTFSEIADYWASQGRIYAPSPDVGGWGKFIRTELRKASHSRARVFSHKPSRSENAKQQLKKGGKGWLHAR